MRLLSSAHMDMNAVAAKRRGKTALTRQVLHAADRFYQLGDEGLLFSDQDENCLVPFRSNEY